MLILNEAFYLYNLAKVYNWKHSGIYLCHASLKNKKFQQINKPTNTGL